MNTRALVLIAAVTLGCASTGHADTPAPVIGLEQDGIHLATYQSIMKCDVDIRADLVEGTHTTLATLKAAIQAIDANMKGTDRATQAKLATWRTILSDSVEALESGGKQKKVLDELQKKLGSANMVTEAQEHIQAAAQPRSR